MEVAPLNGNGGIVSKDEVRSNVKLFFNFKIILKFSECLVEVLN
jgi:hypothetical protein